MKNVAKRAGRSPRSFRMGSRAWLAALMIFIMPVASIAQETTASVRGVVTGPDGAPAAGESVTVTDTRTGASRRVTTGGSGTFTVRGLQVGGPYTIRVESDRYQNAIVTDVFTNLSSTASFDIALDASSAIDEVTVTASQVSTIDVAIGPGSAFTTADIESMPSIQRQIRDVIRIDPRVSVARADNGAGSGINCLGGSSRSNAFHAR